MESFSTKFSGLRETVPDTEDYILLDKIGMVWEYTREYTSIHSKFRNKYQVYRVYGYLGHLLSCRQDPCSIIGFFLGVKRIGRRLLYGSGFHAAQRSSAWSLALQLAGASMQNATDRTGEGSEHPSTENNSDSTKLFQEPSHSKSTEHPRGGAK